MKLNRIIVALAALALLACSKEEKNELPVAVVADYKGLVSVDGSKGKFEMDDVEVNFTPSEDGKTATITLYKVRLAERMPSMDITIPDVKE